MKIKEIIQNKNISIITIAIIISFSLALSACSNFGPKVQAADLMEGISAKNAQGKKIDEEFTKQMADFSLKLFNESKKDDENSLVSPLSVMLALAMAANGGDGETLEQMQEMLGGTITLEELNKYLYTYAKDLPNDAKASLEIANSIWFRNEEGRLSVEKEFLQTNADYYMADAYSSEFDVQTLKDINNWVKTNTKGLIDKILEEIGQNTIMYIINAIVFDAKWEIVYNKNDISTSNFNSIDGSVQNVEFMHSGENKYLEGLGATGFIKPYLGGEYSFVALLPDEDVSIKEFIKNLDGTKFLNLLNNAKTETVDAYLPKFEYDYTVQMNAPLKTMGMIDAFDGGKADFSRLGKSSRGNVFVSEVLHKTFISVDELGTKAGAVTKVEFDESAYIQTKIVKLDRPFLYAIIDNSTMLPVFIGTVLSLE